MTVSLFSLGRIVATPRVIRLFEETGEDAAKYLERHQSGDYGDCGEADKKENDLSVREGFRIISIYHTSDGQKIWVITEADRSSTCILLPVEY